MLNIDDIRNPLTIPNIGHTSSGEHMILTWNIVFEVLKTAQISTIFPDCPISHEQFMEDLQYLQPIFGDKYLQGKGGMSLVRDHLNELLQPRDTQGFGVKQLHRLKLELETLAKIPGFARFCQKLPRHYGFIAQLEATLYINRFLSVKAIEDVSNKQDIDIVCTISLEELFIHVKDLRQPRKRYNQLIAWVHLNNAMRIEDNGYQKQQRRSAIGKFPGRVYSR